MLRFSKIINFGELRASKPRSKIIPNKDGGIYKWWCEEEEFNYLLDRLNSLNKKTIIKISINFNKVKKYTETITSPFDSSKKLYCIYVGKAEDQSLLSRITSQHLGGNPEGSTVRKSLFGLTKNNDIYGKYNSHDAKHKIFNKTTLNKFIDKLYIQVAVCKKSEIIDEEKSEINKLNYIRILNGDDLCSDSEFIKKGGNADLRNAIKLNRRYARNH